VGFVRFVESVSFVGRFSVFRQVAQERGRPTQALTAVLESRELA
jgi:hypothetical protein